MHIFTSKFEAVYCVSSVLFEIKININVCVKRDHKMSRSKPNLSVPHRCTKMLYHANVLA